MSLVCPFLRTTTINTILYNLRMAHVIVCYHPRMRRGNAFGCVCVCVCVCLSCLCSNFRKPWPRKLCFWYAGTFSEPLCQGRMSTVKVMGSRSWSYERNEMHTFAGGLPSMERQFCLLKCWNFMKLSHSDPHKAVKTDSTLASLTYS